MVTKNKRKYQNKPVQRSSALQNYSTKPKYKTKKDQFLKSTLPALVLLVLFVFWTLASVFVFVDKFRSKKDSAMITASAAESDLVFSAPLIGFNGMYFADDYTYIVNDDSLHINFVVSADGSSGYATFYTKDDYVLITDNFSPNVLVELEAVNYTIDYNSYRFDFYVYLSDLNYLLLDNSYFLESVSYYLYGQGMRAIIRFNNNVNVVETTVYLESSDDFICYSPFVGWTQDISFTLDYINNLQLRVSQLESERNALQQSLTAEHNANLELQNRIVSLNTQIDELNLQINSLIAQKEQWYGEGFAAGEVNGYETGYNAGQSSQNTFYRLISATIDVPIKAFTGLFDWNLLGINLKQFFLSILSIMAILAAVKLIMR